MGSAIKILGMALAVGFGVTLAALLWVSGWSPAAPPMSGATAGDMPSNDPDIIRARLVRDIARYNARRETLSTPLMVAEEMTLTGNAVMVRFMMHRFVAPGSRQQVATELRRLSRNVACREFWPALTHGYRFTFSFADITGGEMRFVISAMDC